MPEMRIPNREAPPAFSLVAASARRAGVAPSTVERTPKARKQRPSDDLIQFESEFPARFCHEVERLLERDARVTCLYFIQVDPDGPIKIGLADKPSARLRDLQCASPYQLRIRTFWRGPWALEGFVHRGLAEHRIRGEWFEPAPFVLDVVAFVDQLPVLDIRGAAA